MGVPQSSVPQPESESAAPGTVDPGAAHSSALGATERRQKALRSTAWDMVRSMAVIIGLVVVVLWMLPNSPDIQQPEVDLAKAAAGAQERVDYRPVVPELPEGWRVNATRVDTAYAAPTWTISYLSPRGDRATVVQTEPVVKAWTEKALGKARQGQVATVGDVRFVGYDELAGISGDAWVWITDERVIGVVGPLSLNDRSVLLQAIVDDIARQDRADGPGQDAQDPDQAQ